MLDHSASSHGLMSFAGISSTAELLVEVRALRSHVCAQGRKIFESLRVGDEPVNDAALDNLSHYLALRHTDIADLQRRLQAFGLSSLGRSEAKVLTTLDAIIATLERLTAVPASSYPGLTAMLEADASLRAARDRLFGGQDDDPYTRIMATLPRDAATDPRIVRDLMKAGMTCARINCAHDDQAIWQEMVVNIRIAERELDRSCRVMMDIAGPKIRVAEVADIENRRLKKGDTLMLASDLSSAGKSSVTFTCNAPQLVDRLSLGDHIWINDGRLGVQVLALTGGGALLEVTSARTKGERLKPEKSVNLPGIDLHLPAIGRDDLPVLDFIAENADLVGFSFVQTRDDIRTLQEHLRDRRGGRPPMPIVLKIETPLAVAGLPGLIAQAASGNPTAVMIARGDLAVELGFERLSEMQEEMLWLCEAAHVPVVWATQVLDHLVKDGLPSRAEVTDAAMGQRAECIMLNKGPHLLEGVAFLRRVLQRMDRHQAKKFARFGPLHSWSLLDSADHDC